MWRWIKSTIFRLVDNFFSGTATSIRNSLAGDQSRAESQPLLQKADAKTFSAPILQTFGSH
jgi:hypothetical protein